MRIPHACIVFLTALALPTSTIATGCLGKCDPKEEICRSGSQETAPDVDAGTTMDAQSSSGEDAATPSEDGGTPDTAAPADADMGVDSGNGGACVADGLCDCGESPESCADDCLGCLDDGECDGNEDCSCADCRASCMTDCGG